MADEKRETSALIRRHEQLKRWEDSDTNKTSTHLKEKPQKVKFQDGCVFLAACSSGDRGEVLKLLERGADINTSNIDGLTALHQACIDDNLDMVEFLVDHGADVDVCDNEGWTPLHATASCGFTEIARFLLHVNANVAAVNNDGDLPVDICEDDEMEKLLQDVMDEQGVDADAARQEEENQMLADANKWLNNKSVREKPHHKTGATALHVACAKGYMKVINVLMNAGVDINVKDHDGWTPLHAAAHWGQEEACKVLAEHMCDMEIKNNAGQTAFDVADTDIIKLLDELKKKQASMKDKADVQNEVISTKGQHQKRSRTDPQRSSVTRMSVDQKQNVILKTVEQERVALEQAHIIHQNSHTEEEEEVAVVSTSSGSEEESSESETEKQNEINKQTSGINQPRDPDKPPITTTVEIQKPETPSVDEKGETTDITIEKDNQNEADKNENGMDEVPRIEKIGDSLDRLTDKEKEKDQEEKEKEEKEKEENKEKEDENEKTKETKKEDEKPKSGKGQFSRSLSAPEQTPSTEEVPNIPTSTTSNKPTNEESEVPSWRAGLRKTGSTSMVVPSNKKENETDENLPRSASSPRLALENNQVQNDRPSSRRPFLSSSSTNENQDSRVTDRYLSGQSIHNRTYTPYRHLPSYSTTSYQSAYIPYYRRQQEQNERREREKDDRPETTVSSRLTTGSTVSTTTSNALISSSTMVTAATTTTTTSTISSTTIPFSSLRRSYEPPKRDEEAETQRKARAKRARETRRSTQGVTLEDIQKAEEVLSSMDEKNRLQDSSKSLQDSSKTLQDSSKSLQDSSKSLDTVDSRTSITSDRTVTRTSDITSTDDTTTTVPRRRTWEDRRAEREANDETRTSFRRSRDSKDVSDTGYIPRRERIGQTDSSLSSGSTAITRTSSLRATRLRNGESDSRYDENREDSILRKDNKEGQEKSHEERRESTALRARRARRERRSTGIVSYDANKDDEDDKEEEKKETDEKNTGSRYSSRFGSSTDSLSDRYSRPSSYVEHSRSTPSLDSDYKKLYEDEKIHSEKLQKELESVKKELIDAKADLDRLVKRNEQSRISETNDKREKRALERKLSELEEEVKQMDKIKAENSKLKEENRALTRVISKLSK